MIESTGSLYEWGFFLVCVGMFWYMFAKSRPFVILVKADDGKGKGKGKRK